MTHLSKERTAAADIICREMGKAVYPWTPSYKPRVQWPVDYTEPEKKMLTAGAWAVIAALEEAGWKGPESIRDEIHDAQDEG